MLSPMISRRSKVDAQQIEQGTDLVLRMLYSGASPTNSPTLASTTSAPPAMINNFGFPTVVTQKMLDHALKKELALDNGPIESDKLEEERKHTVVIFSIRADTSLGEEVCICGNSESLGDWEPTKALKLHTDDDSYPCWTGVAMLPSQHLEYKYIIQSKGIDSVRWEEFPTNRKIDPKGVWEVVEDGIFGKRDQRIFTKRSVETMKKDLQQKDDQIKQYTEEKKTMARELEATKEKLTELDYLTQQLKKQLAVLEGTKLETLPTPELRAIAQQSKKTAHKANAILTKRLEDEAYRLRRLRDCSVCMDAQIDTVCLPCGHLALCEGCAEKLNARCVICNAKVQKMQKVYLK